MQASEVSEAILLAIVNAFNALSAVGVDELACPEEGQLSPEYETLFLWIITMQTTPMPISLKQYFNSNTHY